MQIGRWIVWGSVIALGMGVTMTEPVGARTEATSDEFQVAQRLEQLSGTITQVARRTDPNRPGTGTHLTLRTREGTIDVALGPSDYVERQGINLQAGDAVVVNGVRSTGRAGFIAYEVQKGNQTLRLRTPEGAPLWAGRGGRR